MLTDILTSFSLKAAIGRLRTSSSWGTVQPAYPLEGPADRSYSGVLADMDGDGYLDLVVSNDQPDAKVVYLNDGNGRFSVNSTFGHRQWPTRHIRVADLNSDSLLDVVLANRPGPSYICFGVKGGRFDDECVAFAEGSATTITPADFNNDGTLDLAVPHRDGGQSVMYLNDGKGDFEQKRPFGPPDAAIRSAEAADLDADGILDLIVIDERFGPARTIRSRHSVGPIRWHVRSVTAARGLNGDAVCPGSRRSRPKRPH
jgi:hypothetical protein